MLGIVVGGRLQAECAGFLFQPYQIVPRNTILGTDRTALTQTQIALVALIRRAAEPENSLKDIAALSGHVEYLINIRIGTAFTIRNTSCPLK
jgi:hypothetical protein